MGAPRPCRRENKIPIISRNSYPALSGNLHYNSHETTHVPPQKHPLPLDRYRGTAWFFLTFCCENRKKIFLDPTRAQSFLDNLRNEALSHAIAIHAYCIMPDHVHLLSQGRTPTTDLLRFLKDLKRKTGYAHKQATHQQLWQKKSYDHALRSTDSPDQVVWYIWMNPVRANLCATAKDYPWSGSLTSAGPHSAMPLQTWSPPWRTQPAAGTGVT